MYSLHHKKNGIHTNLSVFVYPEVFPQVFQAVSRSDEDLSLDPMTMLKCQLASPYGGSLSHSTDKAL